MAALSRAPKARTAAEAEFLALGNGARMWLAEAAAAGTGRMRRKMAAAVTPARLAGAAEVDWALGHAAVSARFGEGDLASILDHHARTRTGPDAARASTRITRLAQGTASWASASATAAARRQRRRVTA